MSERPSVIVFAGPNGSGKSTLTNFLVSVGLDVGEYINPDNIALTLDLPEPQRSRQAQHIADFQRERCLASRLSFSFETVMSHPSKIDFLVRARDAGYFVTVYFICVSEPEINIRRVENRVSLGGHDVPRERISPRYWRSLALLPAAIAVADRAVLFDNSTLQVQSNDRNFPNVKGGLRPVAEVLRKGSHYQITLEANVPEWVATHLLRPLAELEATVEKVEVLVHQKDVPLG